jgi:hypothetical protein
MPRKKTMKRVNKQQKVTHILKNMQKMEMDWMKLPSKLAIQINKEVNKNKKQESKLKKALNKTEKALTGFASSIKKLKNKPQNKKQLKVKVNAQSSAMKLHNDLKKQLQDTMETVDTLLASHFRISALDKYVSQFDKEWKKSKKSSAQPSKRKTKQKALTKRTKSKDDFDPISVEHSQTQLVEEGSPMQVMLDEITGFSS